MKNVKWVALALTLITLGCVPSVDRTPSAPTWTTSSGWPEATFKGLQPREITGLLTEKLASQGFEPLSEVLGSETDSNSKVTPVDDYHSAFIKDGGPGIKMVAVFNYITLPGKVKVVAKPKVVSLGILLDEKPEAKITHICNDALEAIQADQKANK